MQVVVPFGVRGEDPRRLADEVGWAAWRPTVGGRPHTTRRHRRNRAGPGRTVDVVVGAPNFNSDCHCRCHRVGRTRVLEFPRYPSPPLQPGRTCRATSTRVKHLSHIPWSYAGRRHRWPRFDNNHPGSLPLVAAAFALLVLYLIAAAPQPSHT